MRGHEFVHWVDLGVMHCLIEDFKWFQTHTMHGSFKTWIIFCKGLQKNLLTAFSGRLAIIFDVVINIMSSNVIEYILFEIKNLPISLLGYVLAVLPYSIVFFVEKRRVCITSFLITVRIWQSKFGARLKPCACLLCGEKTHVFFSVISGRYISNHRQGTHTRQNRRSDAFVTLL